MSGYAEHNYPAFKAAEIRLRAEGHEPVNPANINPDPGNGDVVPGDDRWREFMRNDIKELIYCDAIYLLKGWERSRGAMLEFEIASRMGFEIFTEAVAKL